jgi:hypothetical protein
MEKIDPRISHEIRDHLDRMTYDPIGNYIVPGLWSSLVAEGHHSSQKVRLFTNSRTQDQHITPHSHRFDLACMVLHGSVENTIYEPYPEEWGGTKYGDRFMASKLTYSGVPGKYKQEQIEAELYGHRTNTYVAGQWYYMTHEQIHSIKFSKDAMVLVFEGDSKTDTTTILEPFVNGKVIPTFKVEDWMFKA